jgi:CRISPR-associated exonuclease Cas4
MIHLTPSLIIEHLYCARYTFYEQILKIPQYEEKFYKVKRGRALHDSKLESTKPYLRRKLGVVEVRTDQSMTNDFIRGRLDEVLWLSDGTMAPLDYKFAEYDDTVHLTYQLQLYCYAWLIEENFHKPVNKGFLVYTRSKNKLVEVPIPSDAKRLVQQAAVEIMEMLESSKYPKGTRQKKKCEICTYRNFCPR